MRVTKTLRFSSSAVRIRSGTCISFKSPRNVRGAGIGEAVLRLVLAEAEEANVAVSLSVMHHNPARRLYERLGFEYAGETPSDVKLLWRPRTAM